MQEALRVVADEVEGGVADEDWRGDPETAAAILRRRDSDFDQLATGRVVGVVGDEPVALMIRSHGGVVRRARAEGRQFHWAAGVEVLLCRHGRGAGQ